MHSIHLGEKKTYLIGFGNLDKHVLSSWIFVFVRMPWGEKLVGNQTSVQVKVCNQKQIKKAMLSEIFTTL